MTATEQDKNSFMPQLDGLRAFAVFSVMIAHFVEPTGLAARLPFAQFGVLLFFVLSGFLITRILLKARRSAEENGDKKTHTARQFYIRRALRIFPIYYAMLFALALFNVQDIRSVVGWHLSYLSNFYFAARGTWAGQGLVAHFWSLSVEEQFYLCWPWLILFSPSKALKPILIITFLIGPLSRLAVLAAGGSKMVIAILTPCNLDALAAGALLALATHYGRRRTVSGWLPVAGLALFVGLMVLEGGFGIGGVDKILLNTSIILVSVWLVERAGEGFPGWAGKLLTLRPLAYTGKISYGLYLYHVFMLGLIVGLKKVGIEVTGVVRLAVLFGSSFLVASLSWQLFEKPITNLKKRFDYAAPVLPTVAVKQNS